MKYIIVCFAIVSSFATWGEDVVHLLKTESDYCAGKVLNPPHCQEDGLCYHFIKPSLYPREALKKGLEGHATVRFDTNKDGCTENHTILSTSPHQRIWSSGIEGSKKLSL